MNEIWIRHLNPSQLIPDIMVLCMIVGAIDSRRGNKWGLGRRFEAGLEAFPTLLLSMAGIIVLVPLIEKLLRPCLTPLGLWTGADPGIFPGMLLANDMGGFQLARELAGSRAAGEYGGMLLGAIMGANLVFNIPVGLGMIEQGDREAMARGILFGFITLPAGFFVGGLVAGYPFGFILRQLVPVLIASFLFALGIFCFPRRLIRGFIVFGKAVSLLALFGAVCAIGARMSGIGTAPYLKPIGEGLEVVGSIVIVLPGAYVMVTLLGRGLGKWLHQLGRMLNINDTAVLGMIASLANCIPTFGMIKDMDAKGKVVNFAFLTAGAFVFWDHLGFCAAVAPDLILPLIVCKLTAACCAVLLAHAVYGRGRGGGRG